MTSIGFYRAPSESKTRDYRDGLLVREGFMTSRQGYPAVEMGFPFIQREDLPAWRSRDGTQLGPVFFNPNAPYNVHEYAKGDSQGGVRRGFIQHAKAHGHKHLGGGGDLERHLSEDPSFKNGYYYPYRRNHNIFNSNLPQQPYSEPRSNPSNFEVRPDELRKWLAPLRG